MIRFIRLSQSREFAGSSPVKLTAVHNDTTHLDGMAIHVFGGGMNDDICTEFKGTAQDWGSKGVIYNQRDTIAVCQLCHFFKVQYMQCRIGNGFTEYCLSVGLDCLLQLLQRCVAIHKGDIHTHFLQGNTQKIEGAAIHSGCTDNMVTGLRNIQGSQQSSSLSGGGAQSTHTAFQCGNFFLYGIGGGITQTGIECVKNRVPQKNIILF